MTTKYECDRCGEIMDFEDEKSIVVSVGGTITPGNLESNKQMDLCPRCYVEVEEFAKTKIPRKPRR